MSLKRTTGVALLAVFAVFFPAWASWSMEPPAPGEIERLKQTGEWEKRKAFAESIGNHKIAPELLKNAIRKAKRSTLSAQGGTGDVVEPSAPLAAPPPAWAGMPTKGRVKVFALLVEFLDYRFQNYATDIHQRLFGPGNPYEFPYESLSSYYERSSYGQLVLSEGVTLGWVTYLRNRNEIPQTDAGREALIKDVLNYFNSQGHDFSQYDNDGDGYIDYFMVFWAGPDTGWGSFWWGWKRNFGDTSYIVDGKRLRGYSWQWESRPVGSAFNPQVAIHETGHALGLPDYYDYDDTIGPRGGVGGLDMMDSNRGDHNCFSKWVLDWISPTVVSSRSVSTFLAPSGNSADAILLMPGADIDNTFSEYFMVQNRSRVGNDQYSGNPNDGLLIWHVDATLTAGGYDFLYNNSYSDHKLLRLMEADGLEQIEQGRPADSGDYYTPGKSFGSGTTPSSRAYSGQLTNATVWNIAANGQNMTANVGVGGYSLLRGISRVSVGSTGNQGDNNSYVASTSMDGRFVAFDSLATNLVPGDNNAYRDVFVHDRQFRRTTRVSVNSSGVQANGNSYSPSISADGRFVAFHSSASNLVPGDTGFYDVFVHDRQLGATTRVSVSSAGIQGNNNSSYPSISADGRYVAFHSFATNLVAGDTNGVADVFVHDRLTGQTTRASVDSYGNPGNDNSFYPSISADGRYVAFHSEAFNLVYWDTNSQIDVFVHDLQTGETSRVSVDGTGVQGNYNSYYPSISADGRYVAFHSFATNLVAGDTNRAADVFVYDRLTGQIFRVSVDSAGVQGNQNSGYPSISADGRYVAFQSNAYNLIAGDTNGAADVFVHDRLMGQTIRGSEDKSGTQGDYDSNRPSISADGRYVAFYSSASNLVAGDSNVSYDVFVQDAAAPRITVSPASLDLGTIAQGENGTVSQFLTVGNSGWLSLSWSAVTDNAWLSVNPRGGAITPGSPGVGVTISVSPGGLSIGDYTGTVTVSDRNASNSPVAIPVSFRIRHYADPTPTPFSVSLSGTARKAGNPLSAGDELAAFSVHPKAGVPNKYETTLVGHALVTADGILPDLRVYGDDPLTPGMTEGCVGGEEIHLVLWSASDGKIYTAYVDNATGLPPLLAWSNGGAPLSVDLDFIEGTRIPLRTGAWNLFSYGVLHGWHKGASPPAALQLGGVTWEGVANLGDSPPLKSIAGKYDRVLGNDGVSGATFWNPTLPGFSTLSYLAPGYGYWVKVKVSTQPLVWMTVPGPLATGAESLSLNPGWTLAGYWGNERTYADNSVAYDATGELLPLSAWEFTPRSSIGDIWASMTGSYVRVTTFDGQGAHLWNPSLPQTRTLRYLGPGYGYWIKMGASGTLTYPNGTR